ncbi:MAG TPA: hypothetical protein VGG04_08640 [Candidatus Sulfotelmatobacter sp.]
MIDWRAGLAVVLLTVLVLASCSNTDAARAPGPIELLQAIPPANSVQYDKVKDMREWRNPYLIVRADGVALLDTADSAEIILKPEELLPALAKLPTSYWPYGRVVAAVENARRGSEQDGVAIRKNKGIVGGILDGAHIAVKWVPAA